MQHLTYGISPGNYYGKRLCQSYGGCQVGQLAISCGRYSRSQTNQWLIVGLGTRLCVRMCTTLENGVLRNEQQWAVLWTVRAKTTVSTRTSLELVLLNKEERKQERITKMTLSISHTFAFSCLPCAFWESMWALLSIFVGSYMAFA